MDFKPQNMGVGEAVPAKGSTTGTAMVVAGDQVLLLVIRWKMMK